MTKNQPNHYANGMIIMHWLVFLAIIAVYVLIILHDGAPKGSDFRAETKYWHFIAGISVFVLMLIRIGVRLSAGATPAITPNPAPWIHLSSKLVHLLIYLFLLGMPLLGWVALSAGDKEIPLHLPALVAANPELYDSLKGWHKSIGNFGYWLIGVHAAAALFHHYFLKDDTLKRMLPTKL